MAGVSMTSEYECPVCHEDYTEPKILPCAHLACRQCVIAWLGKGGGQAGCPMCRDPILPPTRPGQDDVATLVDALPTDLATVALVESHKILTGPHVCTMCQTNVTATSYCLQCDIKLCPACTSYHQKLPASKVHALEDLSKLTALKLATNRRSTCKSHTDRPTELYCSSHQDLLCMLCATTNHRSCPQVKVITDAAKEKRTELKQQAQRLRQKGTALAKQINECKDKFKAMRRKVKVVFDHLQQSVEERRHQVNDLIRAEEDSAMTSLTELEKTRASVTSYAGTIDHIMTSSPDDGLLLMLKQLTSRLNNLESQSGTTDKVKAVVDLSFDDQILARLMSDLSAFGMISYTKSSASTPTPTAGKLSSRPPATTDKPSGAALARVLKVGDRVRRGPDWDRLNQNLDGGGPGTVIAIPSRIRAEGGALPHGKVDVRWDTGFTDWYWMGHDGKYELDLV